MLQSRQKIAPCHFDGAQLFQGSSLHIPVASRFLGLGYLWRFKSYMTDKLRYDNDWLILEVKNRVEPFCRLRCARCWKQWHDEPGVEIAQQICLDIQKITINTRVEKYVILRHHNYPYLPSGFPLRHETGSPVNVLTSVSKETSNDKFLAY